MSVHRELDEAFLLSLRPRIVRITHRVSGRVALEYDVSHLTPDELSGWAKSIDGYWDWAAYKIEFEGFDV